VAKEKKPSYSSRLTVLLSYGGFENKAAIFVGEIEIY
jgi:hypothetical protein